jgi:hypothetical protein
MDSETCRKGKCSASSPCEIAYRIRKRILTQAHLLAVPLSHVPNQLFEFE